MSEQRVGIIGGSGANMDMLVGIGQVFGAEKWIMRNDAAMKNPWAGKPLPF